VGPLEGQFIATVLIQHTMGPRGDPGTHRYDGDVACQSTTAGPTPNGEQPDHHGMWVRSATR
jgi:hypothetical protein